MLAYLMVWISGVLLHLNAQKGTSHISYKKCVYDVTRRGEACLAPTAEHSFSTPLEMHPAQKLTCHNFLKMRYTRTHEKNFGFADWFSWCCSGI